MRFMFLNHSYKRHSPQLEGHIQKLLKNYASPDTTFELAYPEPEELGDQLEVQVDITQGLGVGEIRLQFEVDPREELGIHLKAGAPNEPLVAEVGPRELPGALLGAIEIDLEPPAETKPEVTIFRLNERAALVEPDLDG